jgi:putative Holliday junction resolvase
VAIPLRTLKVKGDPVEAIVALVHEERAGRLVVGLPLSLTGAQGPQAQRVRRLIEALSSRLSIPIDTWDERLTTVQAARLSRKDRDASAAAILLQTYLDSLRPYG